jgi:UDP-galactopyranose mutase
VLAMVNGQHVPMPINRDTINRLFGLSLDAKGTAAFLDKARVPLDRIRTSEDQLLATVGAELCDLLYRGYSRKFWGLELSELSSSVVARLPVRTSTDDRYFTCRYQAMPVAGYTAMLGHMLGHPRITLQLDTDFQAARERVAYRHLVFTGAIDEFFDFRFGYLPYRSLRFELQHFADTEQHQAAGTVNYPNDFAYTRVTEFRHLTGQQHSGTTIMLEYPSAEGPPYYPVPRPENTARYRRYRQLAGEMPDVTFVGRLARYQYLNMDQVVAAALKTAEAVGRRLRAGQRQSRAAG